MASWVAQTAKNLPAMRDTWARSLGWEEPLKEGVATHSSVLAWRIPWTEERGGLQTMGSQRVGHDWAANAFTPYPIQSHFWRSCPHPYPFSSFHHFPGLLQALPAHCTESASAKVTSDHPAFNPASPHFVNLPASANPHHPALRILPRWYPGLFCSVLAAIIKVSP